MVVYGEGACARGGTVRTAEDIERGQYEPVCPHCGDPVS